MESLATAKTNVKGSGWYVVLVDKSICKCTCDFQCPCKINFIINIDQQAICRYNAFITVTEILPCDKS